MAIARLPKHAFILATTLLLGACGGGGSGGSDGGSQTTPVGSRGDSASAVENSDHPALGNATATLTWTAPYLRQNGESLNMGEIEQYTVRYGTQPDLELMANELAVDGQAMDVEIAGLTEGTWYFSMRTVDQHGLESAWSEVVSTKIARQL